MHLYLGPSDDALPTSNVISPHTGKQCWRLSSKPTQGRMDPEHCLPPLLPNMRCWFLVFCSPAKAVDAFPARHKSHMSMSVRRLREASIFLTIAEQSLLLIIRFGPRISHVCACPLYPGHRSLDTNWIMPQECKAACWSWSKARWMICSLLMNFALLAWPQHALVHLCNLSHNEHHAELPHKASCPMQHGVILKL